MTVAGGRKLGSWVDAFCEYTSLLASPLIFRKWAGICCVAGVLERKLWTYTRGKNLYPNLYVVIVAPPGIGKSMMLNEVDKMWREVPNLCISPTSVTEAALIDSLAGAKRAKIDPTLGISEEFNALNVVSSEFGVLIPVYDLTFMNTLTSLYDGEIYEQRRRGRDIHIKIEKPFLNLIGATTPSSLATFMPEGAWDQGFASRTIFVYSDESKLQPLFSEPETHAKYSYLLSCLREDIKVIGQMYGLLQWEPTAAEALSRWHISGCEPVPTHPRLQHYIIRRIAHLIKLCVIAHAQRSNDLLISVRDVDTALSWLIEAEAAMPLLFRGIASGGDDLTLREALNWLEDRFKKNGPVPRYDFIYYLKTRVKVNYIEQCINAMLNSHMIEATPGNPVTYVPSRAVRSGSGSV